MTRTRDRQRAEQRDAHCKVVALALRATVPQLDDAQIAAALEQARAASGISLRQLADHFAAHPGALSSGDPNCPAVLVRLAHVLHGAGHEQVVRPGCSGCGKVIDLPRIGPAGRVCQMCAVRANLSNCARCGRSDTRIAARRAEGGICFSCYRTDPEVVEECGQCRRLRMPVTRLDDRTPLCARCWTPPQHRCDLCGNVGPADVNNTAEVVCQDCYRRHRQPARPCGRCGRTRPIAKRATDIEPDLCDACNLGPHMLCSVCGRTRPSRRHGADRAWYCHSCAPRPSAECSRCGKERSIHARWPIGPLCAATTGCSTPRPPAGAVGSSASWSHAATTAPNSAGPALVSAWTHAAHPATAPAAITHAAGARTAPWRWCCVICCPARTGRSPHSWNRFIALSRGP